MTEARARQLAEHIQGKRGEVMTRVGRTPPGKGVVLVTEPKKGVVVLVEESHAQLFYKRHKLGEVPKE